MRLHSSHAKEEQMRRGSHHSRHRSRTVKLGHTMSSQHGTDQAQRCFGLYDTVRHCASRPGSAVQVASQCLAQVADAIGKHACADSAVVVSGMGFSVQWAHLDLHGSACCSCSSRAAQQTRHAAANLAGQLSRVECCSERLPQAGEVAIQQALHCLATIHATVGQRNCWG